MPAGFQSRTSPRRFAGCPSVPQRTRSTFGRDYIESAIHFRQKKRRGPEALPLTETQTKVLKALTTMGFRATEARAALERVRTDGGAPEASIESLLRGALGVLADARAPGG